MSRIGNAPINLPAGVEISVSQGNIVRVKGSKGELMLELDAEISVELDDGAVLLRRGSEQKEVKAKHGLFRALLNNMVIGVSVGYKIHQELVGVGFRANAKGQILELAVGYSHPIHFKIPEEVKVMTETQKGKPPLVTLESIDKQLVGQVAAKIRSFRKPEPYKGKGIRYKGEEIRRKAGKSAG